MVSVMFASLLVCFAAVGSGARSQPVHMAGAEFLPLFPFWRHGGRAAAVSPRRPAVQPGPEGAGDRPAAAPAPAFECTHLGVNAMVWHYNGLTILVDPMAGTQPAARIRGGYFQVSEENALGRESCWKRLTESRPDAILLSQGLADLTDVSTIKELRRRFPEVRVICPPSVADTLGGAVPSLTVVQPGEHVTLEGGSNGGVCADVVAVRGARLGPPWTSESAYIVSSAGAAPSIFYEPHGDESPTDILREGWHADVVISPVTDVLQTRRAGFAETLGSDRTLDLAHALGSRVIVPLSNGQLFAEGLFTTLISAPNGAEELRAAAEADADGVEVVLARPGVPVKIQV